ncbi:MAG: helix-turn-helix domain-containing protein [Paramuribaculum sp.]|nr:helix-turn-helix domain-containing protein [Paramuribaculum sp.]MDE5723834.1 helix-turn-helix domain-containing protein [Paramuribaculum sp.]MDE5920307.1 helix-turn-helix domain-containing protein [Paramuribaculum sp.]
MEFTIAGMVCRHCMAEVGRVLRSQGLTVEEVELGRARVAEPELSPDARRRLADALEASGFRLVTDHAAEVVERVKLAVMHHVREEPDCRLNLSACVERQTGEPYAVASRIFSHSEGRTIEKYHIAQKVERVKELLGYGDRTVSEIAYLTGYSTTAHLSRQFKEVTGMTPSQYVDALADGSARRTPLTDI